MDKYKDDELTLDEDDAKRIEKAKTKALKRKKVANPCTSRQA